MIMPANPPSEPGSLRRGTIDIRYQPCHFPSTARSKTSAHCIPSYNKNTSQHIELCPLEELPYHIKKTNSNLLRGTLSPIICLQSSHIYQTRHTYTHLHRHTHTHTHLHQVTSTRHNGKITKLSLCCFQNPCQHDAYAHVWKLRHRIL